jgi:PKD repeat protein
MKGVRWIHSLAAGIAFLLFITSGVDVEAQEGFPVLVNQRDDFQWTIFPVARNISAESFYNYSDIDFQSQTFLEVPRQSTLLLYRDLSTGKLALMIIHNAPNSGPGGQAFFDINGLPASAELTLRDDSNDFYSFAPPTAQFRWTWTSGHTDGLVINNLPDSGTITINAEFNTGINRWYLLTQKKNDGFVERVPMPGNDGLITINIGQAAENITPLFDLKGNGTFEGISADFEYTPQPVYALSPTHFDGSMSQATTPGYEWDFDDDGMFDEDSPAPFSSYVFPRAGFYDVTLRVTDAGGQTATKTKTIEVVENDTTAIRTISTPEVKPETMFRVTLDLKVQRASNGLGVEEHLPRDWIVEPVMNDGAIFKFGPAGAQWVFPTLLKEGETKKIVYDVRVPNAEDLNPPSLPRTFMITGSVMSVSPSYVLPILGEDRVEGVSCLSMPVVFSHLDALGEEVDLRGSEMISDEQLARAIEFWKNDWVVPCTCNNTMTTNELDHVARHHLLNLPVDKSLPEPTSDRNFEPETVNRKITTVLPQYQVYIGDETEGGNVVQVDLTVNAHMDLTGLIVSEQVFEGWRVQPLMYSGAAFKETTNEWYFPMFIAAGDSRSIRYQLTVPMDTAPGEASLSGSSDSWLVLFVRPIEGDKKVELVRCLSPHMAIAKMNYETREIDLRLDNRINREQSSEAFQMWLEDNEVPGTCGQRLDLETLKEIIALMVTETPVER